jgi:hypothetical protein
MMYLPSLVIKNEEGIKKATFSVKIKNKDNLKFTESLSQHSNTFAYDNAKGSVKMDMNGTVQGVLSQHKS